jgi:hypothetical protein
MDQAAVQAMINAAVQAAEANMVGQINAANQANAQLGQDLQAAQNQIAGLVANRQYHNQFSYNRHLWYHP